MRDVRITTLGNGMRVVSDRMSHVETVSLGIWIGGGSRSEREEVNGVAHLVEHMMFKGTERRNARMIAQEIEAVGGHINAYTGRENTAYHAKVLKDDLPLAVDVLADILQHSLFDEEELKRERDVVLQEIGQAQDTPEDVIFDQFQAAAFPVQPLGRPVLGSPEVVGAMRRDALIDYVGERYRAGDMVLVASGHVDHDTLVALADSKFRELAEGNGDGNASAAYRGGEHRETRELEQVHLVLGFRGVGMHDDDYFAVSVLSNLLGGGMSSRLFQEIRERRGLAYSIYCFSSSYSDDGVFGIYAGTGDTIAGDLISVLCDEIRGLAGSLGEDEVASSCTQLKAGLLMGLESTGARCEQLAQHMLQFGRPLGIEELVAKLDAIDVAAVVRAASRVFSGQPTFAAIGPLDRVEQYDAIARRLS